MGRWILYVDIAQQFFDAVAQGRVVAAFARGKADHVEPIAFERSGGRFAVAAVDADVDEQIMAVVRICHYIEIEEMGVDVLDGSGYARRRVVAASAAEQQMCRSFLYGVKIVEFVCFEIF